MVLQKVIRTEKILLSEDESVRTIVVGKGEQYFNLVTSTVFNSLLTIMLVAKDKVSCIPFYKGDRDSCYELEQAEKIVITLGEQEQPGPAWITINIW